MAATLRSGAIALLALAALAVLSALAVSALPPAAPLTARISAFEEWLTLRGARILGDSVDIAPSATVGGGIGLVAARDLSPPSARGSPPLVLFSLPLSCMLSIEHVFLDEWAQQHLDAFSDTEAMAVYLARMRIQGSDGGNNSASEWDPWVQLLPDRFDTNPLFWTTAQLAQLQSSLLRRFIARRLARAERSYALLAAEVRAEVPYADFLWGLAVLWSRTHGVRIKDREGVWQKAPAFVPMADLLNMPSTAGDSEDGGATAQPQQANVECATNDASTHFECVLIAPVRKGEELLVPYGAASNSGSSNGGGGGGGGGIGNGQLLLDYGFAMDNNQRDILQFELPALRTVGSYPRPAGDETTEGGSDLAAGVDEVSPALFDLQSSLLSSVLRRGDPSVPPVFQFHYPPARLAHGGDDPVSALPPGLMQLLRVYALDSAMLARMGGAAAASTAAAREGIAARLQQDAPLSARNEVAALRLLQRAILEALVSYGSSLAEDEAELATVNAQLQQWDDADAAASDVDPDALLVSRYALLLRMGEKRMLYIYAGILTSYMQQIAPQLDKERDRERQQQQQQAQTTPTPRGGKHDEL